MKTMFFSTAVLLLASGAALAQGPGGGPGGMLAAADANKDGVVTKAEFDAQRAARFAENDRNKDGFLSADEMVGARQGAGAPGATGGGGMASLLDADKDGKVSKAEFLREDRMFKRLDANNDGRIDAAELAAAPGRGGRGPGG